MVQEIRVKEKDKDDELGIIKKEITFPKKSPIFTPAKSFKAPTRNWRQYDYAKRYNLIINEIIRRIDENTLKSLDTNMSSNLNDIKRKFVPNKTNLTIFHLRLEQLPNIKRINILSQFLYSASESVIVLPTIDMKFVTDSVLDQEGEEKSRVLSEKKIENYIIMLKNIINEINTAGNSKPFIGIIPIISPKFTREIISLYQDEGICSFVIDAGIKDVLGSREPEFRIILSEINREISPLNETFIYACNLGYGRFKRNWTLADDFLSLFAYVDVFGGTFKTKGFSKKSKKEYPTRAKIFSREQYGYYMTSYPVAGKYLGIERLNRTSLLDYNENEQILETNILGGLIGKINMSSHLQNKNTIKQEPTKLRRLKNIAHSIQIV